MRAGEKLVIGVKSPDELVCFTSAKPPEFGRTRAGIFLCAPLDKREIVAYNKYEQGRNRYGRLA